MTAAIDHETIRFARSATTHPLGKCDTELKTAVPEQMRDEIAALAAIAGKTVAEYIRDELTVHVYGRMSFIRSRCQEGGER